MTAHPAGGGILTKILHHLSSTQSGRMLVQKTSKRTFNYTPTQVSVQTHTHTHARVYKYIQMNIYTLTISSKCSTVALLSVCKIFSYSFNTYIVVSVSWRRLICKSQFYTAKRRSSENLSPAAYLVVVQVIILLDQLI